MLLVALVALAATGARAAAQDGAPDTKPVRPSFGDRLMTQMDVVWAGLKGRSIPDFAWRDKQTFTSGYEDLVKEAPPTPEELADATTRVAERAVLHPRDPHEQWRTRALLARMLHDQQADDEAHDQMLLALTAYPDEDYDDPDKQSSYQHLINETAGWIWDRTGPEAAERFALEHFAADDAFTFFYLPWWEQRYEDCDAIERYGPLIDAVEQTYTVRKRTHRSRRALSERYIDALSDLVVPVEHRVDGDPRRSYFLLASRSLRRTEHRNLVLVLPGGAGQAKTALHWLTAIARQIHGEHVLAVLSAPRWSDAQDESIAWISAWWMQSHPEAEFSAEQLVHDVYVDARQLGAFRVDHTYLWGMSSSGPTVYSAALEKDAPYDGAFINSSVWRPERVDLSRARGRRFYLQQGRDDTITEPHWAQDAAAQLAAAGARVKLDLIDGGHGYGSDLLASVRAALEWLGRRK